MKNIIIIHHDDEDGFGGAYAAWKKFKNKATYIGTNHRSQPLHNIKDKEIYFIDFCYNDKGVMKKLLKNNKKVVVIDHHVSQKDLGEISSEYIFDNTHSGAILAWKYFHPGKKVPKLLFYVEDSDLWKFKVKDTREIIAFLDAFEFNFLLWDKLAKELETKAGFKNRLIEGKAIVKYKDVLVKKLVEGGSDVIFEGKKAFSVNSPFLESEVGNYIYENKKVIGIVWSSRNRKVRVSLRSGGKIDVSKIGKKFGGGGHKYASGFFFFSKFDFPWKKVNTKKLKD